MSPRATIMVAFAGMLAVAGRAATSAQTTTPAAPAADSQPLPRMVAAERAFAAATAEIGVRDGFIMFFAPDAIQIQPGRSGPETKVIPAQPLLAARPLGKLPLAGKLMWEPFTGQVSSDGTLGWLTGSYVALDEALHQVVAQGAYFSVWRRQADATWRVWLDEGIALPDVWKDAAPFRAAPDADNGAGAGASGESIDDAERSVETGGDAWRARLSSGVRLHRDGVMPLVGRDAAVAWVEGAWATVRHTVIRTEIAASGDLAVVIGGYDATTKAAPEHGTFVRMWKRDPSGRWRIVFETSKKR